ncbi:hypothetical protein NLJ89_g9184 [Agrocybe chaxingu]|uniref:Transmembrane protein n=1 Tax=Agrocybe chaxingu TaxID=84603 RepID=A0A9W8K122_9AGAR|nr:hypothetical protein NLJ89_g9184 [Agrocybe chaxingu]
MHNVTIDDRNTTLIAFYPSRCGGSGWTVNNTAGYSGSYTSCTTDEGPSARIDFTGVAVYYRSPVFDGELVRFRLDGNLSETISLSAPSGQTANFSTSRIVWSQTGLQDTDHTLEVFPGADGRTLHIDAFIYTASEATTAGATSSSPNAARSTAAVAASSSSTRSTDTKAAMAFGIAFGVISLAIFIAIAFFLFRRARELNERFTWDKPNPPPLQLSSDPPDYLHSTQEYGRDSYPTPSYQSPVVRPKMDEEAALPMRPLPTVPRGSFTTANDLDYDMDGSVRAWSAAPSQTGLVLPAVPSSHGHGESHAGAAVSRSTTFNSKLEPVRRGTVESNSYR